MRSRFFRSGLLGLLIIVSTLLWYRASRGEQLLLGTSPSSASSPSLSPAGQYRNFNNLTEFKAPAPSAKGRLHLLIPATSSNGDLCKLLLSAQVLGYPTPVLINYGDHENATDPYKQHITKVEGILSYLEQIETSQDFVEDIVLIVDGFDVWLQLRPDVLLKRFYAINAAADARAERLYGEELVRKYNMRQTVIFGPDKICWPVDFSRSACWAVPESTVTRSAFGPTHADSDRTLNDARWLNSGTVMGPIADMKEIFRATLAAIESNYITDSDQFYFAEIFGLQEYARLKRVPKLLKAAKQQVFDDPEDQSDGLRYEPRLKKGIKTEYHIGM